MAWAIIGAILLVLLVMSAGFRKFALVLAAIAGLGIGALILSQSLEERASHSRINATELTFEGVSLKPEFGSGYSLSGRITNRSARYTLSRVQVFITMNDCAGLDDVSNCVVIGQATCYLFDAIPPGQAGDFSDSVYFSGGLHPKGRLVWSYAIKERLASSDIGRRTEQSSIVG